MDILLQKDYGAVSVLTLHRPERMNALDKPLLESLDHAFEKLSTFAQTRVVVITGAGPKAFCAGADINEQRGFSADQAYEHMRFGQAIFDRIASFPKPTIAALNGFAYGGGLELALACDLRTVANTALMGQPEIALGSFPGWGGTQRLPALIGASRAMQMMLTGDPVSAEWAVSAGLANHVFDADGFFEETMAFAHAVARHAGEALVGLKSVVHTGIMEGRRAGLEAEARGVEMLWGSPEQKAAQEAFFARRKR